jgi:hypothetical protein
MIIIIEAQSNPASRKQDRDTDPQHRKSKWATFTKSRK